jgi:hypothetical protein
MSHKCHNTQAINNYISNRNELIKTNKGRYILIYDINEILEYKLDFDCFDKPYYFIFEIGNEFETSPNTKYAIFNGGKNGGLDKNSRIVYHNLKIRNYE